MSQLDVTKGFHGKSRLSKMLNLRNRIRLKVYVSFRSIIRRTLYDLYLAYFSPRVMNEWTFRVAY